VHVNGPKPLARAEQLYPDERGYDSDSDADDGAAAEFELSQFPAAFQACAVWCGAGV
jgi:hypothetical protein